MKKVAVTLCIIVAIFAQASGEPRLVIANNRFDFGLTPQNATAVHYFWFKSVGSDTVRISQIKTGCDCVTMPLERQWIAPGDSMLVSFYWDTQRKVGLSGRYPYVYWSLTEEPARTFLTADVSMSPDSSRPISIRPYKAELSRLGGKSIDSVVITLASILDYDAGLTVVSYPATEYTLIAPDTIKAGGSAKVIIKLNPEYRDKEFKGSVTFQYIGGGNQVQRFTIPVRRRIF